MPEARPTGRQWSNKVTQQWARRFERRLCDQNWDDPTLPETNLAKVCTVLGDEMRSLSAAYVVESFIADLNTKAVTEPGRGRRSLVKQVIAENRWAIFPVLAWGIFALGYLVGRVTNG